MILTDKEAIKQFKRGACYHAGYVWLNDDKQQMMIRVRKSLFSSEMVIHEYKEILMRPALDRQTKFVSKSRQFHDALLGGIFGGGTGLVLGAMHGADQPQKVDYYNGFTISVGFDDLSTADLVVINGKVKRNSLLGIFLNYAMHKTLHTICQHVSLGYQY